MFPLFSRPGNFWNPDGAKEWNKLGTLETKAFAIRDSNHARRQLCNPLRENLKKKRK